MKKFEYKEIDLGLFNVNAVQFDRAGILKQAGEEGWEMVTVLPLGNCGMAFMKREIVDVPASLKKPFEKEFANISDDDLLIKITGKELLGEKESGKLGLIKAYLIGGKSIRATKFDLRIDGNSVNTIATLFGGDSIQFEIFETITPLTIISFVLPQQSLYKIRIHQYYANYP